MSDIRGADLAAALSARRELGPEYDEAVADRLAEKLNEEVARQVALRLAAERAAGRPTDRGAGPPAGGAAQRGRYGSGQKVLVTIVALAVGALASGIVATTQASWMGLVIWAAVSVVAVTVNRA
jgi:hypothetical protein